MHAEKTKQKQASNVLELMLIVNDRNRSATMLTFGEGLTHISVRFKSNTRDTIKVTKIYK